MTELNRKTIDEVRTFAEELGYRIVWEHDLLDASGQISLLLRGYDEELEAYFKPSSTGFLRWDYAELVHDFSSTRIPSRRALQERMRETRDFGLANGLKPYDKEEEN